MIVWVDQLLSQYGHYVRKNLDAQGYPSSCSINRFAESSMSSSAYGSTVKPESFVDALGEEVNYLRELWVANPSTTRKHTGGITLDDPLDMRIVNEIIKHAPSNYVELILVKYVIKRFGGRVITNQDRFKRLGYHNKNEYYRWIDRLHVYIEAQYTPIKNNLLNA